MKKRQKNDISSTQNNHRYLEHNFLMTSPDISVSNAYEDCQKYHAQEARKEITGTGGTGHKGVQTHLVWSLQTGWLHPKDIPLYASMLLCFIELEKKCTVIWWNKSKNVLLTMTILLLYTSEVRAKKNRLCRPHRFEFSTLDRRRLLHLPLRVGWLCKGKIFKKNICGPQRLAYPTQFKRFDMLIILYIETC